MPNRTANALQPKFSRVALGFLAAPLVPAALWLAPGLWYGAPIASFGYHVLFVAILGGYPAAVLLGLPAYFMLRRRLSPRLVTVALAGGLIAAAPWSVLVLLSLNPHDAWIGSCHAVVDGRTTWCGYLEGIKFVALVFCLGAVGGITFWICAIWRDARFAGSSAGNLGDRQK